MGVVVDCEDRHEVVAASEIERMLALLREPSIQLRQRFGIQTERAGDSWVIRRIWVGGIADRAGLRVADTLPAGVETWLKTSWRDADHS